MSRFLSACQQAVFDQIDETAFWSIAGVYRSERQRGQREPAAFEAAVAKLIDRFPTASRKTIAIVTRIVLARAAPALLDWFWE